MSFELLRDPSTAALIAAILSALITGSVSIFIMHKQKEKKKILCFVEEVYEVFKISDKWKDMIVVSIKTKSESIKEVKDLYFFKLRIKNIGNTPLINQPVNISFPEGAKYLGSSFKSVNIPEDNFERSANSTNEIKINIRLINPREQFSVGIVCSDNLGGEINISMRSVGVESIIKHTPENYESILNMAATISDQGFVQGFASILARRIGQLFIR